MKKIFLFLSLVSFSTLFGQTRLTTEVVIGKTKLVFASPIPRSNVLGFETYDLTGLGGGGAYTFGIGSTGLVPNWTNSGPNYTLHLPYASTASVVGGLLSNTDYLAFRNQRWSTLGNAGTVQATNFLGTTDNIGLSFRTNNAIRATISSAGNFGIGTITPNAKLEVSSGVANTSGVRFTDLNSSSPTSVGQAIGINATGDIVTVAAGSTPISSLTPATFANIIDNTNFSQRWDWSTLTTGPGIWMQANSLVSGQLVRLTTNNAGSSPTNGLLYVQNTSGSLAGALATFTSAGGNNVSFRTNGNNGFGTLAPTSTLHTTGSLAVGVRTVGVTNTLNGSATKIIVNNAATNITLTLPSPATCVGRVYSFTRDPNSTGTITIAPGAGQIQALAGTLGATTTLGLHSATGGGVDIQFWSNGTNWYR